MSSLFQKFVNGILIVAIFMIYLSNGECSSLGYI